MRENIYKYVHSIFLTFGVQSFLVFSWHNEKFPWKYCSFKWYVFNIYIPLNLKFYKLRRDLLVFLVYFYHSFLNVVRTLESFVKGLYDEKWGPFPPTQNKVPSLKSSRKAKEHATFNVHFLFRLRLKSILSCNAFITICLIFDKVGR